MLTFLYTMACLLHSSAKYNFLNHGAQTIGCPSVVFSDVSEE